MAQDPDTSAKVAALDLTGRLLIAMPGMMDPRFAGAVVYLCDYSEEGAMGVIVNKPIPGMQFSDILKQLSIKISGENIPNRLHFGGPVEAGRGFVLHSDEYHSALSSIKPSDGIAMTETLDILEDIASGRGPSKVLMTLGYSGWGAGQLEEELAQNGWLTCDSSPELVFGTPDDQNGRPRWIVWV